MRIAVTGATGFLGKYLVKYLLNCSYELIVIARPEENAKKFFPENVLVFENYYSNNDLLLAFNNVDTVIEHYGDKLK